MVEKYVNIGGNLLDLKIIGMDEALEKINLLNSKLEEANLLLEKIASSKVEIKITSSDYSLQQSDD
ncbi:MULTISPECIES: hypothetical protein [Clostridium]|uniref:hypothetical protein n=1 Tax=Clostridium TaxID=1485 RepID=UPI000C086B3E|nr:hypothetical protein [Clostridium cadaveris]MDU4953448.1 hypothetical protein [Clostridium sp.]NME64426.1 hypothetical protein [Clostridium cadaveris]